MEIALPVNTKTVFAEAIVGEDGALHLRNPAPGLKPGSRVLLTITPKTEVTEENPRPLLGTVARYDDPFGPATTPEEWDALREY